jgi:CheY-like chemotaxis protein
MERMNADSSTEHKGTILCVDDDEDILEMLDTLLESSGYKTLLAHDGQEGLDMFRRRKRDLVAVVLDLRMPKMDGLAAAKEIRKESPDIPLVALSAYLVGQGNSYALTQCQEAGFNAYMTKPFSAQPFLAALEEWVARYARAREDRP